MERALFFFAMTALSLTGCREVLVEDGPAQSSGSTNGSTGAVTSGATSSSSSGPPAQGVEGTVTEAVGDFQCCPGSGTITPISVPVHVIGGLVPFVDGQAPPKLADLHEVTSVHSDMEGHFSVGLVPGTYTLFVEIDGALYLNCYDDGLGAGDSYCSVQVEPGAFAERDIQDSSHAVY